MNPSLLPESVSVEVEPEADDITVMLDHQSADANLLALKSIIDTDV